MDELDVTIDPKRCQSYGACVKAAPEVFVLADGRKVQILDARGTDDETLMKAAKACPYRAITLTNQSTREQIYPPQRK